MVCKNYKPFTANISQETNSNYLMNLQKWDCVRIEVGWVDVCEVAQKCDVDSAGGESAHNGMTTRTYKEAANEDANEQDDDEDAEDANEDADEQTLRMFSFKETNSNQTKHFLFVLIIVSCTLRIFF